MQSGASHDQHLCDRILQRLRPRELFLLRTDWLFQTKVQDALLDTSSTFPGSRDQTRDALGAVWQTCQGRIWGIRPESVRAVLRDPPPELFSDITPDAFARQYEDFLAWVRGFPDAPFGFEFLPVKAYTLRKLDNDGQPSGAEFNVLPQDLVEATKWQRYAPKRQLKVTSAWKP